MGTIQTKFSLSPSGRGTDQNEKSWSMCNLAQAVDKYVKQNGEFHNEEYLKSALTALEQLVLVDKNKNSLDLAEQCFKPFELDRVQFLCAHIINVQRYKKDVVHLMCNYINQGGIFRGCFIVPSDKYDEIMRPYGVRFSGEHYIFGTCIRKEYKVSAKKNYDSRTRTTYQTDAATTKQRNKVLVFHII